MRTQHISQQWLPSSVTLKRVVFFGVLLGLGCLTAAVPAQAQSILRSFAVQGLVGTGENVLLGYFTIEGPASETVLIHGWGPSLAEPGFTAFLTDPVVELFWLQGSSQTLVAYNNNWIDSEQRAVIEEHGWAPPYQSESAIVATLEPGVYILVVTGFNGATGIAQAQVRDLDQGPVKFSVPDRVPFRTQEGSPGVSAGKFSVCTTPRPHSKRLYPFFAIKNRPIEAFDALR